MEPNANPAAKKFQEEIFKQGIPATAFETSEIHADYNRPKKAGVVFTMKPQEAGPVTLAIFSDTCGNLIQVYQPSVSVRRFVLSFANPPPAPREQQPAAAQLPALEAMGGTKT